ncbi:MAG TPA: OsmC family protein [Flavisolibacter sp.]|nr:OsmC family protein [Flavisolibacter sp.]
MVRVELERVEGDFGFTAKDSMGHAVSFDSSADIGGRNSGVRPMQALLMALGSCSAIDIVSILKKQRQVITAFNIIIEGEREAGKEPSLWKDVNVTFHLQGEVDEDKARKACALSIEKYCSVAETLRRGGTHIQFTVRVNQTIKQINN